VIAPALLRWLRARSEVTRRPAYHAADGFFFAGEELVELFPNAAATENAAEFDRRKSRLKASV
jgi:hypothetical protein